MKKIILLLTLTPCFLFAQVDLNKGLHVYLPFSGNTNDESGFKNNLIVSNVTLTADRFGHPNSAYHFNGKNSYMQIRNNPSINFGTSMSIALWVRPTGYYAGKCHGNSIIIKGNTDYLDGNYLMRFSDVYTGCDHPNTTKQVFYGMETIAERPFVQLNNWYFVVWTTDGKTFKIYINGEQKYSGRATKTYFTNEYDLYIGRLNDEQYPYWFNGDLDELRIYNRAITKDEVEMLGKKNQQPQSNTAKPDSVVYKPETPLNKFLPRKFCRGGDIIMKKEKTEIESCDLIPKEEAVKEEIEAAGDKVVVTVYNINYYDRPFTLTFNNKEYKIHSGTSRFVFTFDPCGDNKLTMIKIDNEIDPILAYLEISTLIKLDFVNSVNAYKLNIVNLSSTNKASGTIKFKLQEQLHSVFE